MDDRGKSGESFWDHSSGLKMIQWSPHWRAKELFFDGKLSVFFLASDVANIGKPKPPKSACKELIPSGKLSHSYGKSPFSTGKSTINGHFP
jgi:hypothetical protein